MAIDSFPAVSARPYPNEALIWKTQSHSPQPQASAPSLIKLSNKGAEHDVRKTSMSASISILSATTLGAGTLALPYAISQTGWLFGLLLLVAMAFVSAYAVRILIRAAITARVQSYEELGSVAFPKWGR